MMPRFSLIDNVQNWIFDLDDTLYEEKTYVRSALTHIGTLVDRLNGNNKFSILLNSANEQGYANPIAQAWSRCELPESERELMIAAMRAHIPAITLSVGAQTVLEHLRLQKQSYAIVTDGRSVTQRAKIAALGCTDAAFVSISEEVGMSKFDKARFSSVAAVFPPGLCFYVGDNPAKDFFVPKQLGWKTIMLDHAGTGIHTQVLPDSSCYHPDKIITDLQEILTLL
jgi:putative hydrolase of the HAD superfamily